MAHKPKWQCPNCVKNLPRELRPLQEDLPWLRDVAPLLAGAQQVFRCPYCSIVWRQSVDAVTSIEVTVLGLFRSDVDRLQRLPTGFKAAPLKPQQGRPLSALPKIKPPGHRGRLMKRD